MFSSVSPSLYVTSLGMKSIFTYGEMFLGIFLRVVLSFSEIWVSLLLMLKEIFLELR